MRRAATPPLEPQRGRRGLRPRRLGLDRLRRRLLQLHRRSDAQQHRCSRCEPAATPRPGIPTRDDHVSALAVSGSTVYVGGAFLTIGGQYRPNLARFSVLISGTMRLNKGAAYHQQAHRDRQLGDQRRQRDALRVLQRCHQGLHGLAALRPQGHSQLYPPDGTKRVYAYYRDATGNSFTTSDTIVLDTKPPSGTMQLNKGAADHKLTR